MPSGVKKLNCMCFADLKSSIHVVTVFSKFIFETFVKSFVPLNKDSYIYTSQWSVRPKKNKEEETLG